MKTTFFFVLLLMAGLAVNAQRLAMAVTEAPAAREKTDKEVAEKTVQFVFQSYGVDVEHTGLKEYPKHILGNRVARKMCAVEKIYIQRQPATLGFSDRSVKIYKPAIYNAVTKLDTWFKKSVRKNEMKPEEAAGRLAQCLDVAYIVYYEENTENLEQALKKAKSPEQLLAVFDSVAIQE